MKEPLIAIITGPSGVGKDETINQMRLLLSLGFIVTHTDRLPRVGEQDGHDYHFVPTERFLDLEQQGHFVETVQIQRQGSICRKGTSVNEFKRPRPEEIVVWRVDPTFAARAPEVLRDQMGDDAEEVLRRMSIIYLGVASLDQLKNQLRERDGRVDQVRLRNDVVEWKNLKSKFLNVVINYPGKNMTTAQQVLEIIQDTKRRVIST